VIVREFTLAKAD